ncbi:hypothetical protein NDU88_003091 [Pleurodeles waltl]|uniref:Uncharacterized protein n=1 Tax=Pleurodeles waltl TaxID=8319 RepID=A0AAV7VG78_PLEWA|nr:hypothetical protein NDU88_003091 [Pleurodeles waltl]
MQRLCNVTSLPAYAGEDVSAAFKKLKQRENRVTSRAGRKQLASSIQQSDIALRTVSLALSEVAVFIGLRDAACGKSVSNETDRCRRRAWSCRALRALQRHAAMRVHLASLKRI